MKYILIIFLLLLTSCSATNIHSNESSYALGTVLNEVIVQGANALRHRGGFNPSSIGDKAKVSAEIITRQTIMQNNQMRQRELQLEKREREFQKRKHEFERNSLTNPHQPLYNRRNYRRY